VTENINENNLVSMKKGGLSLSLASLYSGKDIIYYEHYYYVVQSNLIMMSF